MKIRNGKYGQRRAISPIIATVLIIAVTLIAAVAIGGFVFGVFGTSAQSAQISVTGTTMAAASFQPAGTAGTITCVSTAPIAPYITLTNSGTAAAAVTGISITWAGANNNFALTAATTCSVGAAGSASATTYAQFVAPKVSVLSVTGQTYSGTITLNNGAQLLFTGTWQ